MGIFISRCSAMYKEYKKNYLLYIVMVFFIAPTTTAKPLYKKQLHLETKAKSMGYGRVITVQSEINTLSAADDPKSEEIDLTNIYTYFPEGFDVDKIKKVKITIAPQSKAIGDIYNANNEKHYTCVISQFTMPDSFTGGFLCNTSLYFRPYRVGQTLLKATAELILKEDLSKKILPQPMDVIVHVGTLVVGSDKPENDLPSYVVGRNILHSGNQLTTFNLTQSKLNTTDNTGLRYMVSDALSSPNRVSLLSSTLIASAIFDVRKNGSEAVVSPDAFTKAENIYRSDGSGNVLTGFALADQGDGKVSLTFASGRGIEIQRVLDYAKSVPNQWKPIYLGSLGVMDMINYINTPVNYSSAFLNQNFAESMGYYYQFIGESPNVGVKQLVKNSDADTTSAATFGMVLSYSDVLFSITPDKQGQTQLYYLNNLADPEVPEWQKTSVGRELPTAIEGIRTAYILSDGTLVIGYGANTKVIVCQYHNSPPYYDVSRCIPIVVLGNGSVVQISADGQNRIYTLTGDGTITRLVKSPNKDYYEADGTTFNYYQQAFQTQADKGPGATSMVVIGNANTELAIKS